jgi:hypothetical protein
MKTRRRNLLIFLFVASLLLVIAATYFIIEGNKRKNQESSKNLRSPGLRTFTVAPTPIAQLDTIGPAQSIPTIKPTARPTTTVPTLVPTTAPTQVPDPPTLQPSLPPIPSDFAFTLKIYWEEGYVLFCRSNACEFGRKLTCKLFLIADIFGKKVRRNPSGAPNV